MILDRASTPDWNHVVFVPFQPTRERLGGILQILLSMPARSKHRAHRGNLEVAS